MAYVQRPGRVGRDKFHQHPLAGRRLAAEILFGGQDVLHHGLLGGRAQAQIEKAWPGNVDLLHPAHARVLGQQQLAQRLGDLARVALQGFG